MQKQFEMTEEQHTILLEACKPVPYMVVGGVVPRSPQDKANDAWFALGNEMGFDHMTVKPVSGRSSRVFTATPQPTRKDETMTTKLEFPSNPKRLRTVKSIK